MATTCSPSPDGPPLSGLKFNDLDVDCLFEVFKELPFNEKIRYQRVDSKWGELLERIWTKQTVLSVNVCYGNYECHKKDHSVNEWVDTVSIRQMNLVEQMKIVDRLTRRCTRLKAVYWNAGLMDVGVIKYLSKCAKFEQFSFNRSQFYLDHPVSRWVDKVSNRGMSPEEQMKIFYRLTRRCNRLKAVYWDTSLMAVEPLKCLSNCTRLEHLSLNRSQLYLAHFVEKLSLDYIKCLTLSIETPETRLIVKKLVKSTPQLERLCLLVYYVITDTIDADLIDADLIDTLAPALPHLLDLSIVTYNRMTVESTLLENIARHGENIKSLAYSAERHHGAEAEANLLQSILQKMPKLESLNFMGFPANIGRALSFGRLKHIIWQNRDVAQSCLHMLPSSSLRSLELESFSINNENEKEVLKIPQYFPNLEDLEIRPNYFGSVKFKLPDDYFSSLKGLKRIYLVFFDISDKSMELMLVHCHKLRQVTLMGCTPLSPTILPSN